MLPGLTGTLGPTRQSAAATARSARPSGSAPEDAIASWNWRSTSIGTSRGDTLAKPRRAR